jgi:hypothetical protein
VYRTLSLDSHATFSWAIEALPTFATTQSHAIDAWPVERDDNRQSVTWVTNLLLFIAFLPQHQHDELEEGQEPPADHPEMNRSLRNACFNGRVDDVRLLLDAGEDVNGRVYGSTLVMRSLNSGHVAVAKLLHARGAELSRLDSDNSGWNLLHFAANGGNFECIGWMLANTTIGINSTTTTGDTPILRSLRYHYLNARKLLIEKGSNLFM